MSSDVHAVERAVKDDLSWGQAQKREAEAKTAWPTSGEVRRSSTPDEINIVEAFIMDRTGVPYRSRPRARRAGCA